jgi:pyruvate-formate lyase-activating enzyme
MVEQGFEPGACGIQTPSGVKPACETTLRRRGGTWFRLIASAHLSRPEDYFSIYQSGCNHSCLKCHSWEFSQAPEGFWASTDDVAQMAADYELCVTVREPRKRATMFHASDLCHHCGQCVTSGSRGELCPRKLSREQIRFSPQGFGPARNIVAFTGGDLACRAEFYAQATERIKRACQEEMWVLLETNGYGLTPKNLEVLASAGLDSFWLDIKAYDERTYRRLCGTTNHHILEAPARVLNHGFVLEVLSLYIPGWVETNQIVRIAELLKEADPRIPFTLLAFFPAHRLEKNRPPTLREMLRTYLAVKEVGLKHVRLGNCHVFARNREEWDLLLAAVGRDGIG